MGDVTTDTKIRYSIYVPKPLSRINLGSWQRREGGSQSPRFGYDGVSIQSDKSLFVDVTKGTYLQARGGYVAQTTDWLQVSLKPMVLATADSALMGADGTVTVAAGAGQAPTWTMDHGDSLETVPYLNLSLHYRVEEVQNSLFEFFRGRRKKKDPAMGRDLKTPGYARNWELFMKDEVVFDSTDADKGKKEGYVRQVPSPGGEIFEYDETPAELLGGFELLVEKSWQKLWGKADWTYNDKTAGKVGPHDLFGNTKDIRRDPDPEAAALHADATTNAGALAEKALVYGFSNYFSRFDPYLLVDPDQFATDTKLSPLEKSVCWALAKLNNLGMDLKRRTDVLYKLSSVVKQLFFSNMLQNAVAAVDAFNAEVKAIRGNAEMLVAMGRGDRGWWGEQFGDEAISGLGKRGLNIKKIDDNKRAASTAQATVRSGAPYKDPTDPGPTADKGFYGAPGRLGGYRLPSGTQVADGDVLHIRCIDKDKNVREFDTPPLRLAATPATAATSAVIQGVAVTTSTLTFAAGAFVQVQLDGGAWTKIDLSTVAPKPKVTGGSMAQSLYGAGGTLAGKTLTIAVNGADASVTFDATNAADEATMKATVAQAFPDLDVSVVSGGVVLDHKKFGPGASIEVKSSGDAAAPLGLTGTNRSSGATVAALQNAVVTAVGAQATVTSTALKIQSSLTGSLSQIRLAESPSGALACLGLSSASADGAAAKAAAPAKDPKDVTADDLVALFNGSDGAVNKWCTFTSEDGQVVITAAYKGDGSLVEVSNTTGHMKEALTFMGDTLGADSKDQIEDLPEIARGFDDFDKVNTELMRMPDDVGNLVRPLILLGKNAMGIVGKAASFVKALVKIGGIKLPSAKGSIGLIANKGISLGTPDRIVGAGGQGIIFVADGGAGNPDHAKYVTFEDTFNRIIGADFFAKTEPYKAKESLGFRVFSDTTADLTARHTAHLLALGRAMKGADLVGSGVARVAGSYAVEIAAQDKVVIGARQDGTGRVEVLGDTVALGYTQPDADAHTFGLEDRGKAKGWPVALANDHPKTSSVLVHAAEQTSIVVGPYMVQVRSGKQQDRSLATAKLTATAAKTQADLLQKQLDDQQKLLRALAVTHRGDPTNAEIVNGTVEMERLAALVVQANKDVVTANKAVTAAQTNSDEGIIISMRDPADAQNTAASSSAHKGKPSIIVNQKGVTITTTAGDDDDTTARITLDDKGCTVKVGNKAGVLIKNNKVEITDGTKKATLGSDKFVVDSGTVDFSAGQKITLG
jgi:hypothetical protein